MLLTQNINHEMMPPLLCISMFAKSLLKLRLPKHAVRKVHMIRHAVLLMQSHFKDMLDKNLIDKGLLTLDK